jgi:hypothetical protein
VHNTQNPSHPRAVGAEDAPEPTRNVTTPQTTSLISPIRIRAVAAVGQTTHRPGRFPQALGAGTGGFHSSGRAAGA